jgi:hypothetical protein
MSDTFDPYYEWLGIPPKDQPPNHYRLLGIELFESNEKVIDRAADRQMGHLRTFQTGQHARESQRLLNELSKAKICLLNPEKKAAYDASLRPQPGPSTPPQPILSEIDAALPPPAIPGPLAIPLPPLPTAPQIPPPPVVPRLADQRVLERALGTPPAPPLPSPSPYFPQASPPPTSVLMTPPGLGPSPRVSSDGFPLPAPSRMPPRALAAHRRRRSNSAMVFLTLVFLTVAVLVVVVLAALSNSSQGNRNTAPAPNSNNPSVDPVWKPKLNEN